MPYYLASSWKGRAELSASLDESRVVSMQPQQVERMHRHLSIATHLTDMGSSLNWFLYAPYWVINKTGLPLQIRGSNSDIIYDCSASCEEPLLFRFKKRKQRKAKIRVYNSSWSSSFCLDTVGNCGVAVCKDRERNKKYRFFVRVHMSSLNLSKIVTISPFFLVVNNTKATIARVSAVDALYWTTLSARPREPSCLAPCPLTALSGDCLVDNWWLVEEGSLPLHPGSLWLTAVSTRGLA
ncbi:hypothetical protein HPB50_018433 [Hyalomma asiaticum]|uniref:Uncharacterized protein n=1 Tax=Hyalomma asiaticum TaxID=266040 RepID=A0ACB7S7F2_HYAAI|nr:hypothetical protein HPB50_018433 [Hyalomma asiaticum]